MKITSHEFKYIYTTKIEQKLKNIKIVEPKYNSGA